MDQRNQGAQPRALTPALRSLLGGGPTAFFKGEVPLRTAQPSPVGPVRTQQLGSPIPMPSQAPARTVPLLGQQAPAPAAPAAPVQYRKCPGPMLLPDGTEIQPDDYIRLNDLCEIMPHLLEAMGMAAQAAQAKGLAPGQPVPVVGQTPGGAQPVPTLPGFGPSQGPFGGGGGAMFGGGGGGPGPAGAQGPPGPAGPPGPPGVGVLTTPIVKMDGDFSAAAAAAFAPVPGTLLNFVTSQDGPVVFLLQAELNSIPNGGTQNAQIGLRIDGSDQKLARLRSVEGSLLEPPNGDFFVGQSQMFSLELPAGNHTVEVLLRGLLPGEYGVGLGISATISANPESPLVLTALHN